MRILIADDSNVSRHLLASILKKWDYEVVSTSDGHEAWEVLRREDTPRIAILDWMMPGLTGPEVCQLVREKGTDPYVYVLLLTSRTKKEDIIGGMMAGADDYVVKPFDQQELNVRLRAGRRIIDLQDELLSAQAGMRHQATHDALTEIKNRRRITQVLEEYQREDGPFGVIMLDLDRFKAVNDSFGHAQGDAVLIATAQALSETMTDLDRVGRYGGEEFLVVSRRTPEQLSEFAEALRRRVASMRLEAGGAPLVVTASVGAASRPESSPVPSSALLKAADDALYEAKRLGRNRVVIAPPTWE